MGPEVYPRAEAVTSTFTLIVVTSTSFASPTHGSTSPTISRGLIVLFAFLGVAMTVAGYYLFKNGCGGNNEVGWTEQRADALRRWANATQRFRRRTSGSDIPDIEDEINFRTQKGEYHSLPVPRRPTFGLYDHEIQEFKPEDRYDDGESNKATRSSSDDVLNHAYRLHYSPSLTDVSTDNGDHPGNAQNSPYAERHPSLRNETTVPTRLFPEMEYTPVSSPRRQVFSHSLPAHYLSSAPPSQAHYSTTRVQYPPYSRTAYLQHYNANRARGLYDYDHDRYKYSQERTAYDGIYDPRHH